MLVQGDSAPDVAHKDADGADFTLARYRGKPVVVYFYPKADTPGCTNEAKDFTELASDFAALGVPVVGVSKDKPAKLKKFADKYGLTVTLASDEPGGIGDLLKSFAPTPAGTPAPSHSPAPAPRVRTPAPAAPPANLPAPATSTTLPGE